MLFERRNQSSENEPDAYETGVSADNPTFESPIVNSDLREENNASVRRNSSARPSVTEPLNDTFMNNSGSTLEAES